MLLQARNPSGGLPWCGALLLENVGSKPPLHLEGAGAVSSIWHIMSCLGEIRAPHRMESSPSGCTCALACELGGTLQRSRRAEERQADATTTEKTPHTRVRKVRLFFFSLTLFDFLKPSVLKSLLE